MRERKNDYPKTELVSVILMWVVNVAFIFWVLSVLHTFTPRLPPGAVFQTNPAKEWRVVMSDGTVTPIRSKERVAELAWDYWEVNQCPTNTLYWRTVR